MNWIILGLSVIAALATWELNVKYCFGGVRASSIVSLISGLIVYFSKLDPDYGVAVMGASFAAMSTEYVIPKRFWMTICGIVFALIFLNLPDNIFPGFGGKLGTTACISVVMTLGFMRMITNVKNFIKKVKKNKKEF